jgi:hypothetical protein
VAPAVADDAAITAIAELDGPGQTPTGSLARFAGEGSCDVTHSQLSSIAICKYFGTLQSATEGHAHDQESNGIFIPS